MFEIRKAEYLGTASDHVGRIKPTSYEYSGIMTPA
jgi:hypothetical protein